MKKQRVLVLVHETLVPPANSDGYSEQEIDEWRTEYDVTTSLRAMGHEVQVLGVGDNLAELRNADHGLEAGRRVQPARGVPGHRHLRPARGRVPRADAAALHGLQSARHDDLARQGAVEADAEPTTGSRRARFALLPRNRRYREPRRLKFPLFVKSATEDASLGISQASIVDDAQKLRERVEFIHEQTSSDALVEEYIEGREIYIGVMGNERLTTLPLWELKFGTLPDVMAGIATRKVKWDRKYQRKHGIDTGPARDLPAATSSASPGWRGASIARCA